MPLQIRRGTDAERLGSFTPVEGELIYTTDTKKLYVGDGATVGGVAIDTVSSGGGGGASVLNDLSDVIIETLNDGDVLTYDGVNWSADSIGNIISLDDLSGVVIETVNAGDVLTYDGVNWTADSVESVSSLDDLSDVVIENAVSGSILKYDGVNWTVGVDDSGVTSINDLSDVFIENAASGSMLTYDGVNWTANNSDINITGDVITSGDVTANVVYADFHGPSFGDVFADDTGLEIEALNGEPGVFSARYAGNDKNAAENINKVLENMKGITNRNAQFRTVFAVIVAGKLHLLEGIIKGTILIQPSGNNGFGYDPIFCPNGYTQSFAEISLDEKSKISHRGLATEKLVQFLKNHLNR